ncbi:hypothetical protein BOVMAS05_08730 [Streptococcus uberis]
MGLINIIFCIVGIMLLFNLIILGKSILTGSYNSFGFRFGMSAVLVILAYVNIIFPKLFLDLSYKTNVIEKIELVSLGNTDKIIGTARGSFLTPYIDIDENPVYRYMYKKVDGEVAMGEIDATTPVKEIDNGQARIEVVERCYTEEITRLLMGACNGTETTIYLPKDSIVKNFEIDVTK